MINLKRVLVADDHALFRRGLNLLLRNLFDQLEITEAQDVPSALDAIAGEAEFDLVLMDLAMPGMSSWNGLISVVEAAGETPVVILSAHQEPDAIRSSIEAGARGYLLKSLTEESLRHAIALILAGEVYVPPTVLSGARPPEFPLPQAGPQVNVEGVGEGPLRKLTRRQSEVVMLMIEGDSNKIIARKLGIYESTVKAHIQVILQKLGAANRTQASMIIREWLEASPPGMSV